MKISDLVIVTATGDCVETCCPWEIGSGDTFVTYDFTRLRLFFENEPDGHFQGVALEPETKQTRGALWSEENQNPPPPQTIPAWRQVAGMFVLGNYSIFFGVFVSSNTAHLVWVAAGIQCCLNMLVFPRDTCKIETPDTASASKSQRQQNRLVR